MSRAELAVWAIVVVTSALAVAWLVERRQILSLRAELEAWGKERET